MPMPEQVIEPSSAVRLPRRAWVEQIMGLPISVHLRGEATSWARVETAVAELYFSLRQADAQFSTYLPTSEVSAMRRGETVEASREMREVLSLCEEATRRTGGAFNANLPTGFDPSGLVKGWAVERAVTALREAAAGSDRLVNAGGDVLLHAEAGRTWQVGIEDPRQLNRTLRVLSLSTGAIATSGTAHRGPHITDPLTGQPADGGLLSATVVCSTLLWADVYATAAYFDGTTALSWLSRLAETQVLLVRADGSMVTTSTV